jgi:hypothetical protein
VKVPKKPAAKKSSPVADALEAKVKPKFKSGPEELVADQLSAAGIRFSYEGMKVPYTIPAREATYHADFPCDGTNIILEVKGAFGGKIDMKRRSAEVRQKMILLKEQHPELDIRFVFERASTKIYPGGKTTNAQWAEDHGFMWADKSTVPPAWLAEILMQQKQRKKK